MLTRSGDQPTGNKIRRNDNPVSCRPLRMAREHRQHRTAHVIGDPKVLGIHNRGFGNLVHNTESVSICDVDEIIDSETIEVCKGSGMCCAMTSEYEIAVLPRPHCARPLGNTTIYDTQRHPRYGSSRRHRWKGSLSSRGRKRWNEGWRVGTETPRSADRRRVPSGQGTSIPTTTRPTRVPPCLTVRPQPCVCIRASLGLVYRQTTGGP
jgi:hypothetical protein